MPGRRLRSIQAVIAASAGVLLLTGASPATAADVPSAEVIAISPTDTPAEIEAKAASVVPSARQLAWQRQEHRAFLHWGINAYDAREHGTGVENPDLFQPTKLNTDQWAVSLKNAGFKSVILTAKHHDGFLLFPSKYSDFGVASSSYKHGTADVVKNFSASARKYGLKFGVYISPSDLHEAQPGGRYDNGTPATPQTIPSDASEVVDGKTFKVNADEYNTYFMNTLYELLTRYGDIDEVWWDGANPTGRDNAYNYTDWIHEVRTLQPGASIFQDIDVRWVGNEHGVARESEWSPLPINGDPTTAADRLIPPGGGTAWDPDIGADSTLAQRKDDGTSKWDAIRWAPAECDVSIMEDGWFWPSWDYRTLSELEDIYYTSVGRNCQLLMNVSPDPRGLLDVETQARLFAFGHLIQSTFAHDLVDGAMASDDAGTEHADSHTPGLAVDGSLDTSWQPTKTTGSLVLDLHGAKTFDVLSVQEDLNIGQRTKSFALDTWTGGKWVEVATDTTIGHKKLVRLDKAVTAEKIRLRITAARANPAIAAVGLYRRSAENLAQGKPAKQSTSHERGPAERAVDGNTDGNFWNESVSLTADQPAEPYPWWQVDLGAARDLGEIAVYNRTDCCSDRVSDYWVFASDKPFDTTLAPAEQAKQAGVWSSHQTVTAGSPTRLPLSDVKGRYVMVQQSVAKQLGLAEVQVFPKAGPADGYTLAAASSDSAAQVKGNSRKPGAAIVQYQRNGSDQQLWKLQDAGNGAVKLVSVRSGLCMEVSGDLDGAAIVQGTCTGADNQAWTVTAQRDGTASLTARSSGKALTVDKSGNPNNSVALVQQPYTGQQYQRWYVLPS